MLTSRSGRRSSGDLLGSGTILREVEAGASADELVPLVDASAGGSLLSRVSAGVTSRLKSVICHANMKRRKNEPMFTMVPPPALTRCG